MGCEYSNLPDGAACDDGLFYTHADECINGKCTGSIDYCFRDDMSTNCISENPCLWSPGTCDPATGACVYIPKNESYPCASQWEADFMGGRKPPSEGVAVIDGVCSWPGLCLRPVVDPCDDVNCTLIFPDVPCDHWTCDDDKQIHLQCHKPGKCFGDGKCTRPTLDEGMPCDDGNDNTYDDICLDGYCIGHAKGMDKFKNFDSSGRCANL